jgi:hypothetical protein
LSIVELETERFDKMKFGAGGGAEASDVAGVGRDLGFKEYDVHGRSNKFESPSP